MTGLSNADENHDDEGTGNGGGRGAVGGAVHDGSNGVRSGPSHAGGEAVRVSHQLAVETQKARDLLADMRDLLGEDEDLIASTIEGETNLNEAMTAALKRIAELDGMLSALEAMAENIKARSERLSQQHSNLRSLLCVAMEAAGKKKLESPLATASLRAVPPKAEIIDEAAIPAKFWKAQDPKLDRRAVLDALKAKEAIPGAVLSNGGVTISVRIG